MDDYATAASAYGWISAWEQKNGRIFDPSSLYCQSIENANNNINLSFSTTASICLRDRDSLNTTICRNDITISGELKQEILNANVDAMCFNSKQSNKKYFGGDDTFENPNYGAGLMTSLSSAFYSLKVAGAPQKLEINDETSNGDKFKILLGQELFKEAQNRIDNNNNFTLDCWWFHHTMNYDCNCRQSCTNCDCDGICEMQGNSDKCEGPYAGEAQCLDCYCGANCAGYNYKPQMYPIIDFMKDYFRLESRNEDFGLDNLINNGKYKFDYFLDSLFSAGDDFFHYGRLALYKYLSWIFPYHSNDQCKFLGLPAMWIDVPPVQQNNQPSKICKDALFYGWVYTDEKAGGTEPGSRRAKIVDNSKGCFTENYPEKSDISITFGMKRNDVCNAYKEAFAEANFYHDFLCDDINNSIGWNLEYKKGAVGNYKLLIWFKDLKGNLKCFERPFEVVDDCSQAPPTNFGYLNPLNDSTIYSDSIILEWLPSANADYYDVYFGTDSNPPLFAQNVTQTYYQENLVLGKKYYWKIVAKGQGGTFIGPIWSFSTATCLSPEISYINNLAYDQDPCADTGVLIHWPAYLGNKWNDGCTSHCNNRKFEIYRKYGLNW